VISAVASSATVFALVAVLALAASPAAANPAAPGGLPAKGASAGPVSPASGPMAHAAAPKHKKPPAAPVKLVDINSATLAELKSLPGIGQAEAERIVAQRPYLTKGDLVLKKVLPAGPYMSLKNRVVAMPPKVSKTRS
jgi:DNA uptake protein ComE-like DNA-binding protein